MALKSIRQLDGMDAGSIPTKEIGTRIREARIQEGLTMRAVAEAAGVSPGTVQKIEVGRLVPSVEVFVKIATALHRRAGYLLGEDDQKPDLRIIRSGCGRLVPTRSPARILRIAEALRDPKMEACIIELSTRAQSGRPLTYKGEVLFHCLSGTVKFSVRGATETLREGDTLHMKADIPHRWENPGRERARMIAVWTQG